MQPKTGTKVETFTHADGSYEITLAPGTYTVILQGTIIEGQSSVTVRAGDTLTADYIVRTESG
jgi:hypothetical protein